VENHHTFLILEHDPMLYEDAKETFMPDWAPMSMKIGL
jgi:hypothetical protein